MFHQTFQPRDLILVGVLVLLEGLLSIDNALVLGLLAGRLPPRMQAKALTYGLVGSFAFRLVAILAAAWLLKWWWVKLLGGGYLLYVSAAHFFFAKRPPKPGGTAAKRGPFWMAVLSIELTDIAFAIDSILAGIALVGPLPPNSPSSIHPKLWVIFAGGMIGVVMMRAAAAGFILLLRKFPRFETAAYLLVTVVGFKLMIDGLLNGSEERINFQSPAAAGFWIFWSLMAISAAVGFLPRHAHPNHPSD